MSTITEETPAAEQASAVEASTDWDALLEAAMTEDKTVTVKRNKVAVPPAVLNSVKKARENEKFIYLPYDKTTFQQICDVFYSAGDLLEPKGSVGIVRVKKIGDKVKVYKAKDSDDGVTHVRISVANRRGQKANKTDE